MRRRSRSWLNQVYYSASALLLALLVAWSLVASLYYPVAGIGENDVGAQPIYLLIIVFGIILQVVIGLVCASIGHRLINRIRAVDGWVRARAEYSREFDKTFDPVRNWPKEQIAQMLLAKETQTKLDADKAEVTNALKDELDMLILSRREVDRKRGSVRKLETRWHDASKLLFKIARLCQDLNEQVLLEQVELQYRRVRKILLLDLFSNLVRASSRILSFLVGFLAANIVFEQIFGPRTGSDWIKGVGVLPAGALVASLIYLGLQFVVRWFTEKSWTDLDDIIVGIVAGPVAVVIMGLAFFMSIKALPEYFQSYVRTAWREITHDVLPRVIFIIVLAWLVVFIYDRIIIYILRRWAERSEQKYDDMFVRLLQVFGGFLVVSIALGAVLVSFQPQISEASGGTIDNVLLPYSIFVGVVSALLGLASQEAMQNLFGGVLLQIDKPFDKGDRLVLQSGEICDVQEIGMRSTTLYNVIENTEISIPNRVMASEKITNVSRPDWQLRIPLRVAIPHGAYMLTRAEEILLDIAYLDREIDQMRLTDAELSTELKRRNRTPLLEAIQTLVKLYPQVMDTEIWRIRGGVTHTDELVFGPEAVRNLQDAAKWEISRRIDFITRLRQNYVGIIKEYEKTFAEATTSMKASLERFSVQLSDEDTPRFESMLDKLATEVVYRVIYESDLRNVSAQGSDKNTILSTVLDELARRNVIAVGYNSPSSGATTVELISELLNILGSKVAVQCNRNDPDNDLTKAVELIAYYVRLQENKRLQILRQIEDEVAWLSDAIFTIADVHRIARKDMQVLISELTREPTIYSRLVVSDDGSGYVDIDLNVYATHLERRFEVTTKLNREIQRRFIGAGIKMWDMARSGDK